MMLDVVAYEFPLLLPYGLKCLALHLILYVIFRNLLPSRNGAETADDFPWKKSPSLTAHRLVAFFAMIHWTSLGFHHIREYDYSTGSASESNVAALVFVPAGYDIAQYAMGALLIWDIPSSLVGGSGPTDIMMHIHHLGMVLVTSCVLGLVGPSSGSSDGIVGTHVAPIFLGAIELSSIPLQIVDLFHPKKSPHWNKFANYSSSSSFFSKLCATINEISRILFAVLFLLVRGLYFPYTVATIAVPDFYAEGSLPSMILLVMSMLFTLLQMYWATLVFGQVKSALFGSAKDRTKSNTSKDE
mmetsp:Transcript_25013/g.54840  ORF Transcript_25013/g.54840 Transcript_25013/m.54840 type:complete len:300 (-) Transcript_25013:116-1015(-)